MTNDKANQICAEKMGLDKYLINVIGMPDFCSDLNAAITLLDKLAYMGWSANLYFDSWTREWKCEVYRAAASCPPIESRNQHLHITIVECALRAWEVLEEEK